MLVAGVQTLVIAGTTGTAAQDSERVWVAEASEFQPEIPWAGRINAVTRHPTRSNEALALSDTGGLFKTLDGGKSWRRMDELSIISGSDLAYSPSDPEVVVATALRDYQHIAVRPPPAAGETIAPVPGTVIDTGGLVLPGFQTPAGPMPGTTLQLANFFTSGGGIWVSRDFGDTWEHPVRGHPLAANDYLPDQKCPEKLSAYGISMEADGNRIYVATECGVSISGDQGRTWNHVDVAGHTKGTPLTAIAAIGDNQVLVGAGGPRDFRSRRLFYSGDGGRTWALQSVVGELPGVHNIGDSPRPGEAFLVTMKWERRPNSDGDLAWGLVTQLVVVSTDAGGALSFTTVATAPEGGLGCGGIGYAEAYTRLTAAAIPNPPLEVYFGNTCGAYHVTATPDPSTGALAFPSSLNWNRFRNRVHADARHVHVSHRNGEEGQRWVTHGLGSMGATMLANDGGLAMWDRSTSAWAHIGSGPNGINALQLTEVTGQRLGRSRLDVVFATWDNNVWSSRDGGATWPFDICCEGYGLMLEPQIDKEDDTLLTGTFCGACVTLSFKDTRFGGVSGWKGPTNGQADFPTLIRRAEYVQAKNEVGSPMMITRNYGQRWDEIARLFFGRRGALRVSGQNRGAATLYQAFNLGGRKVRFYDGGEKWVKKYSLSRITAFQGTARGKHNYRRMIGFGGFGSSSYVPWDLVYGVNPKNPSRMVAPDIFNRRLARSDDGGDTWSAMTAATDRIVQHGKLSFVEENHRGALYPLVSAVSYSPYDPDNILLGTRQGGTYFSSDAGSTWSHVAGSETMINTNRFYWSSSNQVLASTFGRGLWKVNLRQILKTEWERIKERYLGEEVCADRDCRFVGVQGVLAGDSLPIGELSNGWPLDFDGGLIVMDGAVQDAEFDGATLVRVVLTPGAGYLQFGLEEMGPEGEELARGLAVEIAGRSEPGVFEGIEELAEVAADRQILALLTLNGEPVGVVYGGDVLPFPEAEEPVVAEAPAQDGEESPEMLLDGQPYIQVLAEIEVNGIPVLQGEDSRLTIFGQGFYPNLQLQILVDDLELDIDLPPTDADGTFRVELEVVPVMFGMSDLHRVMVRQSPEGLPERLDFGSFGRWHLDDEKDDR